MRRLYTSMFILIILLKGVDIWAQNDPGWGTRYPAVDERLIVETKWRYTYALHLESNTIIHQAEDFYDYFLNFRYDNTYEQYLNGEMNRGKWNVDGSMLKYQFKNVDQFEFAKLTKESMVLEFTQPNSKGTYQYHFIRVDSKSAPFIKPAYELPDVIVETVDPRKGILGIGKNKKKKKKRRGSLFGRKKKKGEVASNGEYISIELIGGGYYGGVDPVLRDYIYIKNDGRLIKEFKSQYGGLVVTKRNIPRSELEEFAEYITAQNFFEFERVYDCDSAACLKRKQKKPTPVPLRLVVAYGQRKKVITVNIWGRDKHNVRYINYPKELDNIVDAIQRMAHRLETAQTSSRR